MAIAPDSGWKDFNCSVEVNGVYSFGSPKLPWRYKYQTPKNQQRERQHNSHLGAAKGAAVGSPSLRAGSCFLNPRSWLGGRERRFVKRRIGAQARQIRGQLLRFGGGHNFRFGCRRKFTLQLQCVR
jgi:hypothetical protein